MTEDRFVNLPFLKEVIQPIPESRHPPTHTRMHPPNHPTVGLQGNSAMHKSGNQLCCV